MPAAILFFGFLILLPSHGRCESPRITMATEHWPPFRILDDKSPSGFRGVDIDIAEAIAEAIDVAIEIEHFPWARALKQMETGQADLITGVAYTEERAAFLHYIPVIYFEVQPVFITSKGKASGITSYGDLHGPSIGYSINSAYFEPFDSDPRINRVGFSTEAQLLKVMSFDRVDVIVGTDPNISYQIRQLGYGGRLAPTAYQPKVGTALYFAVSRNSPFMDLADEIETALRRLVDSGLVETILESYR
jgi:polar amino acid transport system substrate-binding protein